MRAAKDVPEGVGVEPLLVISIENGHCEQSIESMAGQKLRNEVRMVNSHGVGICRI